TQFTSDWTGFAIADWTAVAFHDRNHLGSGAGQEYLIRGKDIVARQRRFLHRNAGRAGQIHDGIAGDAFEDAGIGRRRFEDTVLDDEDVVAGALRDLALVVEHQGLDAAGADALDLGEDVVQVIERLDARIGRVGMVANRRGRDDVEAVIVELRRV